MPATTLEPTLKLTEEQIRFFHSEGFLKLDAITDQEEVAWLRELYDRLFAEHWDRGVTSYDLAAPQEAGKKPLLPQIGDPLKVAPELNHTRFRTNALAIAQQLFGPEVQYRNEH